MKKIFIRSPYFIEVDEAGQTGAKIEIFLWNKGTTEPIIPNYTLTKNIASASQTLIAWNVANYAKEYIQPIAPVSISVPTEENVNTWCYMKIKTYKLVTTAETFIDTETFVCFNGYTQYLDGYNQSDVDTVIPLVNTNIKLTTFSGFNYINVWIEENEDFTWSSPTSVSFFTPTSEGLWKLPYDYDNYSLFIGLEAIFGITTEQLCEVKYTPITCKFINRFGGWQFLTFFKANSSSIDVTSKDFDTLPSSINYNVLQGSKKIFNSQGKQKIKCNTGWVDENYFELIQDLLLSETVLLDNKPVIVKSQSSEYKTILKDKNINYEIEFEYNFGLINDVI
jgi:hypothetical protein